jgi:hypothetical protein
MPFRRTGDQDTPASKMQIHENVPSLYQITYPPFGLST